MMYSQYFIGVPFVTAVLLGAMDFADKTLDPGPGIVINSLSFVNDPAPSIVQNRTINAVNKITATWDAKILAAGSIVCDGDGAWAYPAGTAAPMMAVDDWVGVPGCWESLPVDVTLQACAKYQWGDGESVEACSLGFRKVEDNG